MQTYGKIDSKFRFVILASKRAKQLLRGSKAKIKTKSKNPIRIAQIEVKEGLIDYDILQSKREALRGRRAGLERRRGRAPRRPEKPAVDVVDDETAKTQKPTRTPSPIRMRVRR